MCDDATRLIKGEVINNKEPETNIAAWTDYGQLLMEWDPGCQRNIS